MNFPNSLSRFRKPAIIVGIILAVAVVGFFGYARFLRPQPADVAEDQNVVAVTRGDLIERVSISGNVNFPDSERLVFGASGTVEEVNVKEGERVARGDKIASLDPETIASLEQALAQANVDLQSAEDALSDFLETPPLTLAEANRAVVKARADIVKAEEAAEGIRAPSEHRLAEARAAVSAANLELRRAQDALDDLLDAPESVSAARAEAAVSAAKLALQQAEKALEDAMESPTDSEIAKAAERIANARVALDDAVKKRDDYRNQKGMDDAQRRLDKAQAALTRAERDQAAKVHDAGKAMDDSAKALDDAAKNYVDQFSKWLGIETAIENLDPDYATALSGMGIDLAAAFSESDADVDLRGPDAPTGPQDDPATPYDERVVFSWLSQAPFDISATCDEDETIPIYAICVENEFRTNGDAYKEELDKWNSANLDSTKTLEAAQDAVDNAEDELADAREALADLDVDAAKLAGYEAAIISARAEADAAAEDMEELENSPTAEEIQDSTDKVAVAKAEVGKAEEDLAELTGRTATDAAAIADARERVNVAQAAIAEREKDLADLQKGENHPDYDTAVEDVKVAKQALAEREKELREMLPEGRSESREALLTQNVAAANSSVSQAQRNLDDATLTAPWDGFVSQVEVEEGDKVEAGKLIVDLVNTGVVEIDGSVDEIDVLRIEVGSAAEVTLDALGGRALSGSVSFIDAAASESGQGGVVSVPVKVRLDMPGDLQIPKGLSAVATITVKEVRDVLLVPQRALRGTFGAPTLQVMVGEETNEVPVVIGESDNFMVVIESGVSEGDMIVVGTGGGDFGQDDFFGPPPENGPPPGDGPRGQRGGGGGP